MNHLQEMFENGRQSPWLDNLTRSMLGGKLAQMARDGVRGVTSNPSIFQKSIETDEQYIADIQKYAAAGQDAEAAYWTLVQDDIVAALEILSPIYAHNPRLGDGCVSLEVSPRLASDSLATIEMGQSLWSAIAKPNLMIKVPATKAGLIAITELTSRGINVNVTLIFSLERYREVIEAYLCGLEKHAGDLSTVHSVASFFVSRTDVEVDKRLEDIGSPEALAERGKAALASAQLAYGIFQEAFSTDRWKTLIRRGANVQRPLWASTSTKNPDYPDLLYVTDLILPQTVNTLPEATIVAIQDHGQLGDIDVPKMLVAAKHTIDRIAALGINMDDVAKTLESEGVEKFQAAFEDVLRAITTKAMS